MEAGLESWRGGRCWLVLTSVRVTISTKKASAKLGRRNGLKGEIWNRPGWLCWQSWLGIYSIVLHKKSLAVILTIAHKSACRKSVIGARHCWSPSLGLECLHCAAGVFWTGTGASRAQAQAGSGWESSGSVWLNWQALLLVDSGRGWCT